MIGLAEISQSQQRFDEAIKWREKVRALDPEAVDSHIALVGLYMDLNRVDAARELARALEGNAPNNLKIIEAVGRIALASDNFEDAAAAFARIAERVLESTANLVAVAGL